MANRRSSFLPAGAPPLSDKLLPDGFVRVEKSRAGTVRVTFDGGEYAIEGSPDEVRQFAAALILAAIGDPGFEVIL